jgi:hypothetical protein
MASKPGRTPPQSLPPRDFDQMAPLPLPRIAPSCEPPKPGAAVPVTREPELHRQQRAGVGEDRAAASAVDDEYEGEEDEGEEEEEFAERADEGITPTSSVGKHHQSHQVRHPSPSARRPLPPRWRRTAWWPLDAYGSRHPGIPAASEVEPRDLAHRRAAGGALSRDRLRGQPPERPRAPAPAASCAGEPAQPTCCWVVSRCTPRCGACVPLATGWFLPRILSTGEVSAFELRKC